MTVPSTVGDTENIKAGISLCVCVYVYSNFLCGCVTPLNGYRTIMLLHFVLFRDFFIMLR